MLLEVEEWDAGDGVPTEEGCELWCTCETSADPCCWSYREGLELRARVYAWARKRVRVGRETSPGVAVWP